MRSIAYPEGQHDYGRREAQYVLDRTPAVRFSSWLIVLLVFALAGSLAYLAIDWADQTPSAVDTSAPTASPPAEPPATPQLPSTAPLPVPSTESVTPPSTEAPVAGTGERTAEELITDARGANARGEHQAALTAADGALALDPDDPDALLEKGRAHLELKQLEAAEQALVRSIDVDPADATSRNLLGLVYLEQGRGREALDALQDAASLAPDDLAIRKNLERARERFGSGAASGSS